MSGLRVKDQADFDLDRFIDMFDTALSSNDPRVVDALRSLLMVVILTKPEPDKFAEGASKGPLRRLVDDVNNLNRRTRKLEESLDRLAYSDKSIKYDSAKGWHNDSYSWYQEQLKAAPIPTLDAETAKRILNSIKTV
jgi:hypothetical protein